MLTTPSTRKRARYDSGEDLIDPSDMFANMGGSGMGGFGMGGGGGVSIDPEMLFNMMGGGGPGGGGGGGGFRFSTGGGGSPFASAGASGRRAQGGFPPGFSF